jgi:hypothetical protein
MQPAPFTFPKAPLMMLLFRSRLGSKDLLSASPVMLASVDVNSFLKALLEHYYSTPYATLAGAAPSCAMPVCVKLIFAMVCLPRVLVLPQSCFLRSGYLVAGGYVAFFAAAT